MAFFNNNINSTNSTIGNITGTTIFSGTNNLSNIFVSSAITIGGGLSIVKNKTNNILNFYSFSGNSPDVILYESNNNIIFSSTTIQKFKTSNQTTTGSNRSRGIDSELFFYINSGERWFVEYNLFLQSSGTTSGVFVFITGDTNPSIFFHVYGILSTSALYGGNILSSTTQTYSATTYATFNTNGAYNLRMTGTVFCSGSSGTVYLQVLNNNASFSAITYSPSYLLAKRIS